MRMKRRFRRVKRRYLSNCDFHDRKGNVVQERV